MSDDYSVINRKKIIDVPIDKVFSAVYDQDELTKEFSDIAVLDKKKGGRVSFKFLKSERTILIRIMK